MWELLIGTILVVISVLFWVSGFISAKHDYQKNPEPDKCSFKTTRMLWLSIVIGGVGLAFLINSIF